MVRPESNSRPPAWQPDIQPIEPPVCDANLGLDTIIATVGGEQPSSHPLFFKLLKPKVKLKSPGNVTELVPRTSLLAFGLASGEVLVTRLERTHLKDGW